MQVDDCALFPVEFAVNALYSSPTHGPDQLWRGSGPILSFPADSSKERDGVIGFPFLFLRIPPRSATVLLASLSSNGQIRETRKVFNVRSVRRDSRAIEEVRVMYVCPYVRAHEVGR
jgi:hypothetical protein